MILQSLMSFVTDRKMKETGPDTAARAADTLRHYFDRTERKYGFGIAQSSVILLVGSILSEYEDPETGMRQFQGMVKESVDMHIEFRRGD